MAVTSRDGITDHIRAREEEHFRKRDRELIEKLRQADAAARARRALEQEAGVHDPEVLRQLEELGFTPDTIALLPLIPLLQVAWARNGVSAAERSLVVTLARSRGIAADTEAEPSEKPRRRARTVAGHVAQARAADDALMGARSKLAEGVDDLVDILRQPELMEQIPEVNRANFAKHLTITKLKIENAIAIIRAGTGQRDEADGV